MDMGYHKRSKFTICEQRVYISCWGHEGAERERGIRDHNYRLCDSHRVVFSSVSKDTDICTRQYQTGLTPSTSGPSSL